MKLTTMPTKQLRVYYEIVELLLILNEVTMPEYSQVATQDTIELTLVANREKLRAIGEKYSKGFLNDLPYLDTIQKYDEMINRHVRHCRVCGATRYTEPTVLRYWPEEDLCSICMNNDINMKLTPKGVMVGCDEPGGMAALPGSLN